MKIQITQPNQHLLSLPQQQDQAGTAFKTHPHLGKKLIDVIDFNSKTTSAKGLMFVYTIIVLARFAGSRSQNELKETALRDIPGWISWFYLGPAVANGLGYILDKKERKKQAGYGSPSWMGLIAGKEGKECPKFSDAFLPWRGYGSVSFKDIDRLKGFASDENIKSLQKNKAITFITSVLISISALGMFIPWLNTKLTRERVLGKNNTNSHQQKQ